MLTPRQELILRKVVDGHRAGGQPVGSKSLAEDPEITWGASTVRHELAVLEEHGLLAHPHTSAGRVPTDTGYRYFVDRLLPARPARRRSLELDLVRTEIDEAMRVTTETLSQVTNLLALVSAPPIDTSTIRRVEVLVLQPQVLMAVVITSTGGVTKRLFTFETPVDPGLADWAAAYLNERLTGMGLGARMLMSKLADPSLGAVEQGFLERLAPAFTELADTADHTLYVDGAARLLREVMASALDLRDVRDVVVRIGHENEAPALRSLALVAASYGLPRRRLGTVSLIGPVQMDYADAIGAVRDAASQLSSFVEDIYDGS